MDPKDWSEWNHIKTYDNGRYMDYVFKKTNEITKTNPVIKYKDETKYKDVIKYKTVTKYRDVPEYQGVQVKKFNEEKYNKDISDINTVIDSLRKHINDTLSFIKPINTKEKQGLQLKITDSVAEVTRRNCLTDTTKSDGFKELFKQLNEEWKYLEYEAQALLDCQMELAGEGLVDNI